MPSSCLAEMTGPIMDSGFFGEPMRPVIDSALILSFSMSRGKIDASTKIRVAATHVCSLLAGKQLYTMIDSDLLAHWQ